MTYPHRHSGVVLVCGNAFCLQDDLARAREMFPDAPALAVNGSAAHVKAFALFTQHPRAMLKWIAQQRTAYGDDFTVHAAGKAHRRTKLGVEPDMPWIEYWWDGVASNGTSVWGARRLAKAMGFDLVILCGMPLEKGAYADGRTGKAWVRQKTVDHYRKMVERDIDFHPGARSMSGWTRELLGAPE